MKSLFTMILAFSAVTAIAQNKPLTATYKVDSSATKVEWIGKKVTGQHSGTIAVKSGTLTFQGDLITAGEVVVDMKTLAVTDIPAKDENNGKLIGHLSSPDFFNTAKFPEAKLLIKSSEKTASGLKVTADLTIAGKTSPVTFDSVVKKTDALVTAKSAITVDRTKYDIKYGSGSFFENLGDKAINNEFILNVDLTAKK